MSNNKPGIGQAATLRGRKVIWAGADYGWQSPSSYQNLKSSGELKHGASEIRRVWQAVPAPIKAVLQEAQRRLANPVIKSKAETFGFKGPDATTKLLDKVSDKTNVDRRIVGTAAALAEGLVEGKLGASAARSANQAAGLRGATRAAARGPAYGMQLLPGGDDLLSNSNRSQRAASRARDPRDFTPNELRLDPKLRQQVELQRRIDGAVSPPPANRTPQQRAAISRNALGENITNSGSNSRVVRAIGPDEAARLGPTDVGSRRPFGARSETVPPRGLGDPLADSRLELPQPRSGQPRPRQNTTPVNQERQAYKYTYETLTDPNAGRFKVETPTHYTDPSIKLEGPYPGTRGPISNVEDWVPRVPGLAGKPGRPHAGLMEGDFIRSAPTPEDIKRANRAAARGRNGGGISQDQVAQNLADSREKLARAGRNARGVDIQPSRTRDGRRIVYSGGSANVVRTNQFDPDPANARYRGADQSTRYQAKAALYEGDDGDFDLDGFPDWSRETGYNPGYSETVDKGPKGVAGAASRSISDEVKRRLIKEFRNSEADDTAVFGTRRVKDPNDPTKRIRVKTLLQPGTGNPSPEWLNKRLQREVLEHRVRTDLASGRRSPDSASPGSRFSGEANELSQAQKTGAKPHNKTFGGSVPQVPEKRQATPVRRGQGDPDVLQYESAERARRAATRGQSGPTHLKGDSRVTLDKLQREERANTRPGSRERALIDAQMQSRHDPALDRNANVRNQRVRAQGPEPRVNTKHVLGPPLKKLTPEEVQELNRKGIGVIQTREENPTLERLNLAPHTRTGKHNSAVEGSNSRPTRSVKVERPEIPENQKTIGSVSTSSSRLSGQRVTEVPVDVLARNKVHDATKPAQSYADRQRLRRRNERLGLPAEREATKAEVKEMLAEVRKLQQGENETPTIFKQKSGELKGVTTRGSVRNRGRSSGQTKAAEKLLEKKAERQESGKSPIVQRRYKRDVTTKSGRTYTKGSPKPVSNKQQAKDQQMDQLRRRRAEARKAR